MTVTIISEFDIREEIDKLEIGNGVCFVTGDEITRQEDHFEYWPPAAEWQDQPEIIQDKEIIITNVLKNALRL